MEVVFALRSGGQSGADHRALDAFLDYIKKNYLKIKRHKHEEAVVYVKFNNGVVWKLTGWCPKGKEADDSIINSKYSLKETETLDPKERTELNVCDANATLIILLLTSEPGLDEDNIEQMLYWIKKNKIKHLNVAGLRESNSLEIQNQTYKFMYSLFEKIANKNMKAKL
ncbi:29060_t:CDS:2 [Gigaspora margarita]|uniref:29060_t:CDS:1 n=1 Tax=Gigaspora margarita TaxID=4874 RepID=A0ABM8VVU9_GIGMA|nr:29060_t:CDS:2 [Gigaspora margarita]